MLERVKMWHFAQCLCFVTSNIIVFLGRMFKLLVFIFEKIDICFLQ